jgi:predicted 3-demethylubiquinone-9 3-methyltransferase (glyoxalase superfamily)
MMTGMSGTDAGDADAPQPDKVTPLLMFDGTAEAAVTFYTSLFDDGAVLALDRVGPGERGRQGSVRQALFTLGGRTFRAMDSVVSHDFGFTPATSLAVRCDTEAELDRVYTAFRYRGTELMPLGDYGFGRFGWVTDRFGVSWQLTLGKT